MAHVIHPPHIDFHAAPVNHSPSPLGFGFGLSGNPSPFGCANNGHAASGSNAPFQQLSSAMNHASMASPSRAPKRRHEPDDEAENARDVSMGRSPTPPDRPKRSVPKRLRAAPDDPTQKTDKGKEKSQGSLDGENEVDVGVLLGMSHLATLRAITDAAHSSATLPPTALLPILSSVLQTHPALKPLVVSLIPRPTVDTALQALAQSAKKLKDAYPYSNHPQQSMTNSTSSTPFSFGSTHRPGGFGASSLGFGFGHPQGTDSVFSHHHTAQPTQGMRDDYILSRLRPHISEFVSTCFTYLPYFTFTAEAPPILAHGTRPSPAPTAKEKAHPNEVFQFLAAVTSHLLAQPPLAQTALVEQMLPRLVAEWRAWIDRVDAVVNHEGGMFSGEVARGWERTLDDFAQAKAHGLEVLVELRDRWVASVGWLVGRSRPMIFQ